MRFSQQIRMACLLLFILGASISAVFGAESEGLRVSAIRVDITPAGTFWK